MVKVHQVVKIKRGKGQGLVGVVVAVDGDSVVVRVDGVRNGSKISERIEAKAQNVGVMR